MREGRVMLDSPSFRAPDERSGGRSARVVELVALSRALPGAEIRGDPHVLVTDVTHRSSDVRPGVLFFCVRGDHVDGHDYAASASGSGASALVVEHWVDVAATQILVPSVRRAIGPMAAAFFGRPADRMKVVGITGTNGKTTTTYLLESIYRAAGLKAGVVGTTGVRIDGRAIPEERTTPEATDLQRLLARMSLEGVDGVAMEVSSHGLHQHRVDGTRFACAAFTNLTQDHLDYHGTLEAYLEAKAMLFTPELSDRAVVNGDTAEGRWLAERKSIPTVTYGLEPGSNIVAGNVEVSSSGVRFEVNGTKVSSRLRGTFNVYNCLAAFAAAREVGVEDIAIARGIGDLSGVPGRLEPVEAGQPFPVLVDYAHTPDSLDNVLRSMRALASGRLIVVFGCGGDRDRGKRPLMGEAVTRLADLTVITSDNPRSEDPMAIIADIEPGARRGSGQYVVEPDRRRAIRMALAEARAGDVVLIAGKGHETGQTFRDRTLPFDDRIVAAEELAGLHEGRAR
jgi:UDP-N-acetylmuramoyl-L-alanyl-D-glutamate--2,6-diaminopimelate ligase